MRSDRRMPITTGGEQEPGTDHVARIRTELRCSGKRLLDRRLRLTVDIARTERDPFSSAAVPLMTISSPTLTPRE